MAYIYSLADTWADGATTFTAIKMSVTDTASAAGSLLMDLQVGGVSRFNVGKGGGVVTTSPTFGSGLVTFGSTTNSGIWADATGTLIRANGVGVLWATASSTDIASAAHFGWSASPGGTASDLRLARDAANTLAQRNGVNAQAFNLYNTYTDASNYERGFMRFVSNTLRIGTEKLGTGAARSLAFQTDGTTRLTIGPTGTPEFTLAGALYINGQVGIAPVSAGVMRLTNYNADGFSTLQLGLATTGFPALKVSTSTLQVRLGNDSAFTNIQGKLTTEANAVSETITATHTITLYDAAGTAYKVPCVAA